VVLIVGETSAGKTVFLNRWAHALATGETLLGISPPHPLRVLHVDVESPRVVERMHLSTIGTAPNWHIGKVNDERDLLRMLESVARRYDVIIIDSLMMASPVIDENSNSEANRQMVPFLKLAKATNTAILISHNAGEGNPKEKFKSRGATARSDRPDEILNLDEMGGNKRRLKVVKTRFGNLGDTIEFELTGRDFNYRLLKELEQPKSKQDDLERQVQAACEKAGTSLSRQQIATSMGLDLTSPRDERLLDRTLKTLVRQGQLQQPQRGRYVSTRSAT
jgi:archaellum biogenesis ATPase FlaH